MAVAQVSASYNLSIYDASTPRFGTISKLPTSNFSPIVTPTSFVKGSPFVIRTNYIRLKAAPKANSAFIKCEQSANGLDVWLGRVAMVGFAVAISVEISTGKGLLENFGLTSPLPTAALAVAGLGGVLTAVLVFQSASKN